MICTDNNSFQRKHTAIYRYPYLFGHYHQRNLKLRDINAIALGKNTNQCFLAIDIWREHVPIYSYMPILMLIFAENIVFYANAEMTRKMDHFKVFLLYIYVWLRLHALKNEAY